MFKNATFEAIIEKVSNETLTESVINLIYPKSAVPKDAAVSAGQTSHHSQQRHPHQPPFSMPPAHHDIDWLPAGYTRIPGGAIVPSAFLLPIVV